MLHAANAVGIGISTPVVDYSLLLSGSGSSSSDITPSKVLKTKKKGRKDALDMNDPYWEETCREVLDHFSGQAELPFSKDGKIIVGKLKVSQKLFEENFKQNKLDLVKATKNLTAMAWTENERVQRSLSGKPNNKHGGEPKVKATPKKVMSILGSVKAHAIHRGDKEGPGLMASLKTCKKAIGSKVSMDAQSAKRNTNQS